jgi:hypothetical protein
MSLLLRSASFRATILQAFLIVSLAYWGAQKLAIWFHAEPAPATRSDASPKLVQVSLDWQPSCQAPINLINPPSPAECQRAVTPAKPRLDDLEASIPLTFRK